VPRHVARLVTRLVVDYFAYIARPSATARRAAHRTVRRRLLRLRRASRCLGTSRRSSSTTLSRTGSSSSTSPRANSSSTTSPTPRVRVPRHVARLVVDYFASRRLVVDYFSYAARPGASARHTARHAACRRLLRASRLRLAATLALLQSRRASRLLVSRQHWLYFEYVACRRDVIF
jgi:hypothetical protein